MSNTNEQTQKQTSTTELKTGFEETANVVAPTEPPKSRTICGGLPNIGVGTRKNASNGGKVYVV